MGVRLNKVLSELNIGLQTAVDFLKNKKELGEVKDEMTPNTKISDEQYQALVGEFKGDKAVKTQADMIFTKKVKEKKTEKVEKVVEKKITVTEELLEHRPQFKTVGKIDLDNVGKPAVKKEEPPVTAAESPEEEKPQVETPIEEVKEEPVVEAPSVSESESEEPATIAETENEESTASGVKVIGKIAKDNDWYKQIRPGEQLSDIVFNSLSKLDKTSIIKNVVNSLTKWVIGNDKARTR